MVVKKKAHRILGEPVPVPPKSKARKKHPNQPTWVVIGIDHSLSGISLAGFGYDSTLKKLQGPAFVTLRWTKDQDYFTRLRMAASTHELIMDVIAQLKMTPKIEDIFIAQEEPFPPHGKFTSKGVSQTLKQSAEISGSVLGGLLKWGYREIFQIHNTSWRKIVADQISEATGEDVTLYPQKWQSQKLATQYHCSLKNSGKFRSKQWALDVIGPWFGQMFTPGVVPELTDLISHKDGKIPRPEKSKAQAVQPDDIYDALAMAEWMRQECARAGVIRR